LTASALTTGEILKIQTSGNTWTEGQLFEVFSDATSLTTGNLGLFDWSPSSWATASGDLVKINLGQYGDITGNMFAIYDNSSELFSVDTTKITSALPHEFTAAGDVSLAYDLVFTNQTSGGIESYGPLTITAGESFESNNLKLATYNSGNVVIEPADAGYVQLEGATRLNSQITLADDATPDVSGGSWFVTGGTTTITDFDAGSGGLEDGHIIVIESAHAVQIDCNASSEFDCGSGDITLADNDLITFIYDAAEDIWRLVGYVDEAAAGGHDIAEYFLSTETLNGGEIVKVDINNPEHVVRSASAYESRVVGIVSTDPGITLGEEIEGAYPVALAGRVPVKISETSAPITSGDYITTSTEGGLAMKAEGAGRMVGQALENWEPGTGSDTISVFINNAWYDPGLALGDLHELTLVADPQIADYYFVKDAQGNAVNNVEALASAVIGNIRAGFITSTEVISDTITATQGTFDNLLVNVGLVAPTIETSEIKPLEGEGDVAIELGNRQEALGTSGFGRLLIQNRLGETVAEIDEGGNARLQGDLSARQATFSGELASQSLRVEQDASIAGELRVGKIYADEIISRNAVIADTQVNTISGITREEIEALLAESEVDQGLLNQAGAWEINTATGSGALNELALENLFVTGTAAMDSLSLMNSLTIGSDMVISSQINELAGQQINSIDTINAPLSIQSSAAQPLHLMAGLVNIDTDGNVDIAGDLAVEGSIESSALTLREESGQPSGFGKLLAILNDEGAETAFITASGSAKFVSVETGKLTFEDDPTATSSASFAGIVYDTNASAGKARIPKGEKEVIIRNEQITAESLVFVTPTSDTANSTLYIKEQIDGEVIVGFDKSAKADIEFNWWLVDVVASTR